MLPRVVRLLGEAVAPLVVVAAVGQDLPDLPGEIAIVRDEAEGRGPLQGLAAGLGALEGRVDAAYVSSCDVPFLKPGLVRQMVGLLADAQICVPRVGEFFHPLAAVYRIDVLPAVRKLLAEDRLRPTLLFDAVPTRVVLAAELADVDSGLESLRNLNTPEEYEAALRDVDGR